ncbi:cellulose binding domain-containing protein [Streptacidiphilus cavernicola]|uniref:Cellulose binding domain-containing protein n=1 Tax=Streptacidiphilus cavernicola TaxID=3342716 RepID=A0ABV6VUY1_9ACTN
MGSALGRRRAQSTSRAATVFRAVVFFSLVAAVVFVTRPLWHSKASSSGSRSGDATGPAAPLLSVRYRPGAQPSDSASFSQPWMQLVNTAQQPVVLDEVTLRYYFKQEGTRGYAFNCIYAEVGCSHVAEKIVALPSPVGDADHYLQVSFTADAGSLAPKANSGAIELQLYRPDKAAMKESADFSFNGADAKAYRENEHITAYVNGRLAWGTEPAGAAAPASSAPVPLDAAAGVVFDDFHYTGPDDPALNQHGWIVRTADGGPGVLDTWKASGVSFPVMSGAKGGQVLNLRATTDGTKSGTTQAEIQSRDIPFFTGTYAARIHFNDQPTHGVNGDPINEDFYMISPDNPKYSEIDAEYEPNGGWGAPGPRLDTTTWYSADAGDRITQKNMISLNGWHTLVITAAKGVVTYSMDGSVLYTTTGKYYPREPMSANFNTWFVNTLHLGGDRQWDMQVNWLYYNSAHTMTLSQVQHTVDGLYAGGANYVNTIAKKH